MQQPINHHWLPQFLMRPWCGNDGLVTSLYRPHIKVVASRKSPKSLGSVDDLYTINWTRMNDPYYMEKEVFTKIFDTPNAIIRDKMISGFLPEVSSQERTNFAMFLVMLNMRRPEFISNIKESAADDWWNTFKEIPRTVDGVTYIMNDPCLSG